MLWQMGTLVGAPLGICLMSAVALPAILIAVPAYVGRRVSLILCSSCFLSNGQNVIPKLFFDRWLFEAFGKSNLQLSYVLFV